jgi:His/Glu/Gln/Arg/opine family amino acid ABC transporter permease subunit
MEHSIMITQYFPLLLQGTTITTVSWLIAATGSLILGTILGILSCNHLNLKITKVIVRFFAFIAKAIPAYVQILIAYFAIPTVLNINISNFTAGIAALIFCSSGYVTEIIRSGINTIPSGQWEGAYMLGYSKYQTLIRIILPQALKNIFPTLINELEQLLKSTSLLATIGVTELTRTGINIISRELIPIPIYLTIACIYILLSALLQIILLFQERYSYDYR